MRLARVFQDYMTLQRRQPILVWGTSDKKRVIEVRLNGEKICDAPVETEEFSFLIPPQEAIEDAVLEIGDIRFSHVDIGEVWIAGGQSNMEFMLQYTENGEEAIASANDMHLRTYVVGQYSFAGEREEGYKAWNPWDRWLTFEPEHAAELPAAAVYFAKELRKYGVPVGILSCNWGGTSASAWMDKAYLKKDAELHSYLDDFDAIVNELDLQRYNMIKKYVRPAMASSESRKAMGFISRNTLHPDKLMQAMMMQMTGEHKNTVSDKKLSPAGKNPLEGIPQSELMAVGPGDANEPGALYENMLTEIIGYSVKGVIWYQGETDEKKAGIYAKLFAAMIQCWRNAWKEKNPQNGELPFLFVQLAPFGEWMSNNGNNFPILRRQQELAEKTLEGVYMTSVSDLGNVFDIHPKNKEQVGKRLALLARKHVYGENILADAPEAERIERNGNLLKVIFKNGDGLYCKNEEFVSYNGFALAEIDNAWIPPVLDGVNGLKVIAGDEELIEVQCSVENNQLIIKSEKIADAENIEVQFAQTAFYQVNLYNRADVPVKPFILSCK